MPPGPHAGVKFKRRPDETCARFSPSQSTLKICLRPAPVRRANAMRVPKTPEVCV